MKNSGILISIGIDHYQNTNIPSLSYCVSECLNLERIFKIFNIVDTTICLANNNATLERIIEALQWSSRFKKVYVYYSGHGDNIRGESFLYTFNTDLNKIQNTCITIQNILKEIKSNKKKEVALILDACGIIKPAYLNKEIIFFHPKFLETVEDTAIQRSIFTKKIIKKLTNKLSVPSLHDSIKRYDRIRREIALKNEKYSAVFIYGESGLGKSFFLRKIKEKEKYTLYISLPKLKDLTFDIILNLINDEIQLENQEFIRLKDVDPERYIRFFSNTNQHYLLILDHADHLTPEVLMNVIKFLNELPINKIIAYRKINIFPGKNNIYRFPTLSKKDIVEILANLDNYDKDFLKKNTLYNCKTYIELLNEIYKLNNHKLNIITKSNEYDLKKVANALVITGGFINEDLFTKIFKLDKNTLQALKKTGRIIKDGNFYFPHDSVYEMALDNELPGLQRIAFEYWKNEIKKNPSYIKAMQNFILISHLFSITLTLKEDESSLYKQLIDAMQGRRNTYFLMLLYNQLKNINLSPEISIHLCEALIDIGKFIEAEEIIASCFLKTPNICALSAELHWWKGNFVKCIKESTYLLAKQPEIDIQLRLYCIRGIGNFFLGKWERSITDFNQVISKENISDTKTIFYAYFVLATIEGLRGTNFPSSISNFIYAIECAKSAGKISWLTMAYGNIGEILWKSGYYEESIKILSLASHLAYISDNRPIYLEVNRNLLHAYHRSKKNKEIAAQLSKLEDMYDHNNDNFVKMQIVNTLVTHYIFNGNKKYKQYLKIARQLTYKNNEYRIYTLSNLSIASLIEINFLSAKNFMKKAMKLCVKGENWLTMKQCLDDWDEAIAYHKINQPNSKQVFPKLHQKLEIKLLKHAHHLSRLLEYLE